MDRGRSFSILGLSETATKAEVKRAYGRKIARYKGPDYAEEPEYVERKLAQLHQAYQEAYNLAESGPGLYSQPRAEREADEPPKKKTKKGSHLLKVERDEAEHNHREKFHQWMERRDDEKQERKDGKSGKAENLPKLTKPDFSKLKDKLQEIKTEVATQLELNSSEEEAAQEYLLTEQQDDDDSFAEFAKGCIYTEDEDEPERARTRSKQPFDDIETDEGRPVIDTDTSGDSKGGGLDLVKLIISIIIIVVTAVSGCSDDSIDDTDYDYEDEPAYAHIYDEDREFVTEKDERIVVLADESHTLLIESGENDMATTYEEEQSDYQAQAQQFVKNYFGTDMVKETAQHLFETYPSFSVNEEDTMETQLDAIFAFYGFPSLGTAVWYYNPYTGGRIEGYSDYLDYLNQFYEAQ